MRKAFFSLRYWFKPRWDTGIPVPELQRVIDGRPPGRALDLGCGTGTNVRYLAEHGWQVTGIDFVPRAIAKARRKLQGLPVTLLVGDVTRLGEMDLPGPFDLALDIGCFHSLSDEGREGYVAGLRRWLREGGQYSLYAWQPVQGNSGRGISREAVLAAFTQGFNPVGYEQGRGHPSAWYYFKKTE